MKSISSTTIRSTSLTPRAVANYFRKEGYVVKPQIDSYNIYDYHNLVTKQHYFLAYNIGFKDDEGYHRCFKVALRFGHIDIYDSYAKNCMTSGLLSETSNRGRGYSSLDSICDAVYYSVIPSELKYKDGRLKRGFARHLWRRLTGFASNSCYTKYLLNVAISYCQSKTTDHTEASIKQMMYQEFNFPYAEDYTYFKCPFSYKWLTQYEGKGVLLSGVRYYCKKDLDPLNYGYQYVEDYQRTHYMKLNEIYVDGLFVDKATVNLTNCIVCGKEKIVENTEDGKCVDCLGINYKIHDYHTKIPDLLTFKAKKVKPNNTFLGIELEYEAERSIDRGRLYIGKHMRDHALMKRDGSLRDGIEVVSCPAEFDIHLPIYKSFLDNLPEFIKVSERTGMHVHISRNALSPLAEGKLIEFMNRQDNQSNIRKIAMRPANNYQSPTSAKITSALHNRKALKRGDNPYGGKYCNLNASNKNTLEMRIFSTPRTYSEFKIKLEFVKALVDFCNSTVVSLKESTSWVSFSNWLSNQRKSYIDLYTFCKEKSLCV